MLHRPFPPLAVVGALLALLASARPSAATVPADLCTGEPCVITQAISVAADSDLDFGSTTTLVLNPAAALTVGSSGDRALTLRAGSILLQAGATIVGGGATVTLQAATGTITLQRSGAVPARIDVSANAAGAITLEANDDVTIAGNLEARGTGRDAQAGSIDVSSDQAIRVTGSVLANATTNGAAGGSVSLDAGTTLTIDGPVSVAGADFGGGDITLAAADGDLVVSGTLELSAVAADGSGGSLDASTANGDVVLSGVVAGTGHTGTQGYCGDGATLVIAASGDASLGGTIDVSAGTQCFGGEVSVSAGGEFRQPVGAVLRSRGPGAFGSAGQLEIDAGTHALLRDIDLSSTGSGGVLVVSAPQAIDVRGVVDASASGADGVGGTITLQSCGVTIGRTGTLDTRGPAVSAGFGQNELIASGALSVLGTVRATSQNRFVHKGVVPVITGTVAPAATIVLDANLPECPRTPACGDGFPDEGEACDDGNVDACDGCSATCTRRDATCGDGIPECGEQCDDGNHDDGDGCEADCTRTPPEGVRLRGVPLAESGCVAQWALTLPAPALDPESGLPAQRQTCRDGDPACDEDGTVDGVCTLGAEICLKVPDPELPSCAPQAVKLLSLDRPKATEAADTVDLENRDALLDALAGLGVKIKAGGSVVHRGTPVTSDDTCTAPLRLQVPHGAGAAAERTFRISARGPGAPPMTRNGLTLICETAAATCGDGVQQAGEACEDGNTTSCDGCSTSCASEGCGNGVVECGEECDEGDANGSEDGACSATCERRTPELRIPGGGASRYDCGFEWSALAGPDAVAVDRHGLPEVTLSCKDGDPTCDLDATPGRCRVRIWGCFAGADERLACSARAAAGITVRSPSAKIKRAPEVAARATLLDVFGRVAFPAGPGERCSEPIELDVPIRQAWLDLKVEVPLAGTAAADRDALRIRCR